MFEDEENILPLSSCEHVFHKECLKLYVKSELEMGKCPVICPYANCNKGLGKNDIE